MGIATTTTAALGVLALQSALSSATCSKISLTDLVPGIKRSSLGTCQRTTREDQGFDASRGGYVSSVFPRL